MVKLVPSGEALVAELYVVLVQQYGIVCCQSATSDLSPVKTFIRDSADLSL